MNLEKKVSIWKYILNSEAGMLTTSILSICAIAGAICGCGYAWCKIFDHQDYISDARFVLVGLLILLAIIGIGLFCWCLIKNPLPTLATIFAIFATTAIGYGIVRLFGLFGISWYDFLLSDTKHPKWIEYRMADLLSICIVAAVGLALYIIGRILIHFVLGIRPTLALYKQATYLPTTVDELLANNIHGPQELEDFLVTKVFSDKTRSSFINVRDVRAALEKSYMNSVDTYDYSVIPGGDENVYYMTEMKQDTNIKRYREFREEVGKEMAQRMRDWLHCYGTQEKDDGTKETILGHGNDVLREKLFDYDYLCIKSESAE